MTHLYSDVVVVNANHIALELSLMLKNEPMPEQRKVFAGSRLSGYFYLYRSDKHPDTVFECVVSPGEEGEGITSLYKNHAIFAAPGELVRAREALVQALATKKGLSVEAMGVEDPARGRSVGLDELATGQLIDLLAEQMGSSIIVTDSYSSAGLATR